MIRQLVRRWLAVLALLLASPHATWADEEVGDVRVMSFNIRYGTARDGENHWTRRRDFLVETIRDFQPDLLGTQETLAFQRDFLAEKLAEYDHLGVGRNDGRDDGEMTALFYKRERFEKLDGGHFWLSESPDKVGSKSWDSALPRMVTWVKLRDRQRTNAPPLVFFNTHFDHQGATARLESARLLRRRIASLAQDCAAIVTGDFNAGEGSPPYQALFGALDDEPATILDSYRAAHPERAAEEGTFSGFQASDTRGPRIDWIGVSRDWEIRAAAIDRTARNERTPSDHFPVTAVLRGKGGELTLRPRQVATAPTNTFIYCSAAKDQAIDLLRMDPETGVLTKVARLKTPGEPGALAISPDGSLLFAALRSTGQLASFRIDLATGKLTAINVVDAGADPAQISVDRAGRYLLTAYYVAAKVSVHRIAANGSLGDRPEQELPTAEKAHAIVPDAANRYVFVPHTGPNAIFQFAWNGQTGRLTPHPQPRLDRPLQSGPRHLAWHPSKPIAYVDNEQSSSVTAYRLGDDGSLIPGQTVSTLPPDFRDANSTAEIKVHPGGRFLYVSNRGHDSVAVVRLDDSGEGLTFVTAEPTEKTPRSFDIDPSGRFLLCAGESSGRLAISRIDPDTGRLTRVHTEEIGPMLWWVQTHQPSQDSTRRGKTEFPPGGRRFRKVLFLGNSITLHAPAPNIGWQGNWGMAASAPEKDYVHRLLEKIAQSSEMKPTVMVKNIADFERRLDAFDVKEGLKEELAFDADLIVVAIGENVSALPTDEAKARYRAAFAGLLAELKKQGQPTLFVRSSFWSDPAKDEIMKTVCEQAGGVFVDMGKLGREESHFARSERKFEHAGVAAHPGDKGMQAIADELWNAIQSQAAAPNK